MFPWLVKLKEASNEPLLPHCTNWAFYYINAYAYYDSQKLWIHSPQSKACHKEWTFASCHVLWMDHLVPYVWSQHLTMVLIYYIWHYFLNCWHRWLQSIIHLAIKGFLFWGWQYGWFFISHFLKSQYTHFDNNFEYL
jgi:hypothetical protein